MVKRFLMTTPDGWRFGLKVFVCGVLCAVVFAQQFSAAHAESWAERLGYPAEKRIVIIHAHGVGISYETNVAAEKLLAQGMVQSASALAPGPWFRDFASWAQTQDGVDAGLELTLNSDLANHRWKPIAGQSLTASLVDSQGYLWPRVTQTMVNGMASEVEHELEAQLRLAKFAGVTPTHFATHLGALFSRPDYAEAYLRFARRHWIPAVVVEITQERLDFFRSQGYPLPDDLIRIFDSYPLPKVDDLKFFPITDSLEEKRAEAMKIFESLSPGITQIAVVAAVETPALKRITDDWQQRVWEMEILADPELRKILEEQGVIFTNWREVMRRFDGS